MGNDPAEALTARQACLVLNALPHIGPIALHRLVRDLGGDPRAVFAATPARLEAVKGVTFRFSRAVAAWRGHFDLAREEARLAQGGADFLALGDAAYPALLREIHDPPLVLYRRGPYGFDLPAIAIVGTRRATPYGRTVAKSLGAELARRGFAIVSGLARGIDTAAHEGALEAGGRTVAVLGTGVDLVYPPENRDLLRRIGASGAVLSEFPLGRPAARHSFAMRNRIVAGLSAAVIVAESAVDGGAMITARLAGEQGRMLLAVPGRIDQPTSAGCHQLIRDGATLLTRLEDILEELAYVDGLNPQSIATRAARREDDSPALTEAERRVWDRFRGGEVLTADALAADLGLPAAAVAAALLKLELGRRIARRLDGAYEGGPG